MNTNVLQKLLKPNSITKTSEEKIEEFLRPVPSVFKKIKKNPGRPKVEDRKKARNFTLCLAPQYIEFLDKMSVKDSKVKGRGRKIRFIIERFIEHEKRSLHQIKILRESLTQVQKILSSFGARVKKSERLELSTRDKAEITKVVEQAHLIVNLLGHNSKSLQKILPKEDWVLLRFCLDWKTNKGVSF